MPIFAIQSENLEESLAMHGAHKWSKAHGFKGKAGDTLYIPSDDDSDKVLIVVDRESPEWTGWQFASLSKLPPGTYKISTDEKDLANDIALGFLLGTYSFDRYKTKKEDKAPIRLIWPPSSDRELVKALAEMIFFSRDLITTPAEDMGPQHLVGEARAVAAAHPGASIKVIQGQELISQGFPAIHTVGRASHRPPALIDIRWAPEGKGDQLPLVTLVGKGVCFDSGGLDIKGAAGMKYMKLDMGGAAMVLSLSHAIMSLKLPVQLRVLIPTVENSISANPYRPLDVLNTRSGRTVENGNTDAEGRLILCDALTEAVSEKPDLLIDMATLTGAARTALGPDIPAVFSNNDEVWWALESSAARERDPVWRMPLLRSYRKMLDSPVADIASTGPDGGPGAIVAALFLQEFVPDEVKWVHVDTPAYNKAAKGPGRPEGGEAFALRAILQMLLSRYATS